MFRALELFRTVVMTTVLNNSKVLNFRFIKNFKILEHYVLNRSNLSFGRHPLIAILGKIFFDIFKEREQVKEFIGEEELESRLAWFYAGKDVINGCSTFKILKHCYY